MTDRDRFRLRGSVKSSEMHRTWYSRECGPAACETEERSDVTTVEFRPDGSLQRHWYKNPTPLSSEWTNFYEYSDDNRLVRVRTEQTAFGNVARRYEYDFQGRISQMIFVDKEGKERLAEVYSYESNGTKKKIVEIQPELLYAACTSAAIALKKFPLSRKFQPKWLRSSKQLEAVRTMFTICRRHRYDEHDHRIETAEYMAPNDFERETFAYNEFGDVISRVSESSHAEYSFEEEGELIPKPNSTRSQRFETQFRYEYDPNGNWIEKIAETSGGPIWTMERRTIRYFS